MSLAEQTCVPCRGGVAPLTPQRAVELLAQLEPGWRLNAAGHLERSYGFSDFAGAMRFANAVAAIAESEQHHPDLHVAWGACRVEIWTHAIQGLTESDFVLAAKIDRFAGPD